MNPSKITTTVGLNIGKIDIAGVSFNFWDLGGQEELQSLWDKVINNKFNTIVHFPFFKCIIFPF
jgi:GTPase SAR1 family protein